MLQNKKPYILLIPTLLTIGILFLGGLVNGLIESLYEVGQNKIITFNYYKEVLSSEEFWNSLFITLRISVLSTLLSIIIGTIFIILLFILQSDSNKRASILLQRLFQIPMLFPYLVSAYLIFLLLTQGGFLSRLLFNIGFIQDMSQFPVLVNDKFGWGVIVSYVWKTSPFVVLMVYPILLKIEDGWIEVGRVFGASKLQFFKEIILPMIINPLEITSYIIFSYAFLAFEIPYILGATYPKTLSVYSYQIYTTGNLIDRPKAFAINVLSLLFITIFGLLYSLIFKRKLK